MQTVPAFQLVPASPNDVVEIDALRAAIDWGPGGWFLGPLMAAGGRMVFARDTDGALLGMGGGAVFRPSGFIANMVVRPDIKRRGIGRGVFEHLIGWLKDQGIENIQLEATDEGRPLYEQYGFSVRWESVMGTLESVPTPGDERGIALADESAWRGIAALDRLSYGGDRAQFLRQLAASGGFDVFALTEAERVRAFGFRRPGRLGPVVADSPESAERLARALSSRAAVGDILSIGHPQHAAFWEALGMTIDRHDARMTMGAAPADRVEMIYGMVSAGAG